ncbi:alanine--tRNA ligase [Candidatus Pacearchaeota archaeon]|nr:alanine--tRNA ligase [Candidatus Pacearchaeota archaeon]
MDRKELIKKYIEFFKSKGHAQIKNSSLVPENDPTVLFTTAGMHPLVPYLLGQPHPQGKRVCNVQRCIRTGDIDEVGDTTHHTFFEMLGNWSIGDYFKKEAIEMSYEFLTQVLKLPKERLAFTVFGGDSNFPQVPIDNESADIWESLGVAKERIAFLKGGVATSEDNWWGPAGQTGPCGPCTEMFYWKPNNISAPKVYDPTDKNWVEIWNDVLMEYIKDSQGNFNKASQQNVDTGMGTERTIAVLDGFEDNYLASMWQPIIQKIELISKHKYNEDDLVKKSMRIIADHIKAAVFIINDGITPANSDQGYVLRRLIRRAIRFGRILGIEKFTTKVADAIYPIYNDYNLDAERINLELEKEEENFLRTLEQGLRVFEKITEHSDGISSKNAFLLYQSYGFPIEMTEEIAREKNLQLDKKGFEQEMKSHQDLSRTASAGKFKSGLADNSIATTRLHTACHILNQALREVLHNKNIFQKGSNITPERLRFDFNFDRKLTEEEIQKIEDLVNEKISQALPVDVKEMSMQEANKLGAIGVFEDKYGARVKVYSIGNFSKELCAGPHVGNTKELGKFKIQKEESSSAGVRRIKAVLE